MIISCNLSMDPKKYGSVLGGGGVLQQSNLTDSAAVSGISQ